MILPFEPTQENIEWLMHDNHLTDESVYNKYLPDSLPYKLVAHYGYAQFQLVYQYGEQFFIWKYDECIDSCLVIWPCKHALEVIDCVKSLPHP